MTTQHKGVAPALVKALSEIEGVAKDKVNPHFKSKYADLSSVLDVVRPVFSRHGLAVTQETSPSEDGVIVETVVLHESGEERRFGKLFVPANKKDAQGAGSALTYARRYSLMAAFGVAPEDDDGNAAARTIRNNANDTGEVIDDAEWASLVQLIEASGSDTQRFCTYMRVPDLKSIRKADYQRAVDALKAKIPAKAA